MESHVNRRAFVAGVAGALAGMSACARTPILCPGDPAVSDPATPLTIDTHAHFFNGSDLQIREFLSQTTVGPDSELFPLVHAMGAVLQRLAWQLAPGAARETAAIGRYAARLQECGGAAEQMRAVAAPSFREGYEVGRRELQSASAAVSQSPAGATVLGPKDGAPGLGAAIADLPSSFDEFEQRRSDGATVLGSQPTLLGYLQFVLHHFNHRHVNAVDYLTTYSRKSARKVDLVVASLVDYDYWLARGRATPTTLAEQVELMSRLSVLLGGRVHGFAPYCPFREVVTAGPDGVGDSMRLVRRAVESRGFVGVKLYPPMGFAPWGNAGQTAWQGKATLLPASQAPGFGRQLDQAMEKLFRYCLDNEVPVMAHTNHSNGPYEEFKALAGSEYWSRALAQFPGLKVSFGHFGDTDLEDHEGERTRAFLKLVTPGAGTAGANTYADSSYFAGVLINQVKVADTLQSLYAAAADNVLYERLMYGSDWTMILPQVHVERYLSDFIDVMRRIQPAPQWSPARGTSLADAFFGQNAADYLGLRRGQPNRRRLESFYAANDVPEPDWMRKLG
jgi:predicted TIM-barrel fold metal-dependent hydrolase